MCYNASIVVALLGCGRIDLRRHDGRCPDALVAQRLVRRLPVGESVVDPQKYYLNNVVGTLSLLDRARWRTIPVREGVICCGICYDTA